jgi:F-type H+-transporting ATPase subunit b
MRLFGLIRVLEDVTSDETYIKKLIPNVWDFVIQLLAFIVLILIVIFLAYKPVKKNMKARQDYINKNIHDSEDAKKKMEARERESRGYVDEAKTQANQIVTDAKAQAQKEASAILSDAKAQAAETRKKADEEIALAKEKSKQDVRGEIVDVALAASSQVLGRQVNEDDEKRLLQQFVDDVEAEKK